MSTFSESALASVFQSVGRALDHNRELLNRADLDNGNHGDHMVVVFRLATLAAESHPQAPPADVMDEAARLLEEQRQNGSAQIYAAGLRQMAGQFRKYEIALDDLILYVRSALAKEKEEPEVDLPQARSGDVLKALVAGLAAWGNQSREGGTDKRSLDMGSLFEFGMAYLQAKSKGGSRAKILADAAVSVSPLQSSPHRSQSGKIAIQAMLEAMQSDPSLTAE